MKISKEKIKNIVFPYREGLENKWWHRLIKVFFVFLLVIVSVIVYICFLDGNKVSKNDIDIINNLRQFTKEDSKNLDNTIPYFLKQNGELGCLEGDEIKYVSEYYLEEKSLCNKDIIGNFDKVIVAINKQENLNYTQDQIEEFKNKTFEENESLVSKGEEKRYCFIKDVECASNNIIKYKKNVFYYCEPLVYVLPIIFVFYILCVNLYYRVFIYIIYGNKNKNDGDR